MNTMPNINRNSGSMLSLLQKRARALRKQGNTLLERSHFLIGHLYMRGIQ